MKTTWSELRQVMALARRPSDPRRPLLVGEDNPRSADPTHALLPYPDNCAGHRLSKILGLSRVEYMMIFDRVNLCLENWVAAEARERAAELDDGARPLVLLGVKVTRAFGLPTAPFVQHANKLVFPHPSGRCRVWNDEGTRERARATVTALL